MTLLLPGLLAATASAAPVAAGVAVTAGGGREGFTRQAARDRAPTASAWELRVQLWTEHSLSLETAYLGAVSTELVSTTLESNLRANLRPGWWQPFAVLGFGWRRYDARTVDAKDNTVEVPLGLGLQVSDGAWRADARFTYRITESYELIGGTSLDTWAVTVRVGRAL
jgi:hypothetical protein